MSIQKKYQVFVSSTYIDLKNERQSAVEAILQAGDIPAGMELFTASDQSQWDIIKRWIDESDIYMLILGGRYGSIEPKTKKSYTHLEYEYAKSINKPLFAIVIREDIINKLPNEFVEKDNPTKLTKFRKLVLSNMSGFYSDTSQIQLEIFKSLNKIKQDNDLIGWIKGDEKSTNLATEILRLNEENRELREENQRLKDSQILRAPELLLGINDGKSLCFDFYIPKYSTYEKQDIVSIKNIPANLYKFIKIAEVEKYNNDVKKISENDIEIFNNFMKDSAINKYLSSKLKISLKNIGSLRATNIRVKIKFPSFINLIRNRKVLDDNIELLKNLAYQTIPKLDNPLTKAEKQYNQEKNPLINYLGTKSEDDDFEMLGSVFGYSKNEYFIESYEKEEEISLSVESLLHETEIDIGDFYVVPTSEGAGEVEVFLHCEEYPSSVSFKLPITVTESENKL